MRNSLKIAGYVWIALLLAFIAAPMVIILPVSFGASDMFQFPPAEWSMERYSALFEDGRIWSSLTLSLIVGVCSTALSVAVGVLSAVGIVRGRLPFKSALESLFLGPLIVPLVTTGIGFLIIFVQAGLAGSPVALVLAHSVIIAPYVIRIAIASIRHLDPVLEEAAIVHGAKESYAFATVVLPQLTPALISGALLSFLVSLDEYTVTNFLVQADTITLPIRIFQLVSLDINPVVTALAGLTIIVSTLLIVILEKKFRIHRYLEG